MSKITGDLIIKKVSETRWALHQEMEVRLDNGRVVTIEPGFTCDFGSIPPPFRVVIPPLGSAADVAFLVHDRLYWGHRDNSEDGWSREEADDAMLELMLHLDVAYHIAWGAWTAVRAGSMYSWLSQDQRNDFMVREDHEFLDE